ncbi:DMT family transporter [Pelagibacterales bacterium SAG-MED31]|nr:DMT family transporter [Pelagibacterales bacterium SAG-MED31]
MINNKSVYFAFVLLIASSLFWSGNFFTGKIASLYDLAPFKLSFLRWSLAFFLLLPFTYRKIILDFEKYKQNLPYLIITSILGVTIFNSFTYLSLQTSMVINSSIMASITPLLIILFSWLIFKTQTYFMQFFGIILSIVGVLLIISKANFNNLVNLNFTIGDLWMLAAVFSWGLYSVLLKKIDSTLSQLATLEVMIFIGLIFIFPFYFFESLNNSFLPKDSNEILMITYVAIFASITSFFAWNKGVSIVGANKASLFLHLIPVFSSMWAILFLDEIFSLFHLFGTVFIIFGIVLSNVNRKAL